MITEILQRILTGPPLWVWPLLLGLVYLGIRASKFRRVPTIAIYMLPLLGLISINVVSGLEQQWLAWSIFFMAYGIGAYLGYAKQASWLVAKEGRQVTLAGEWVTLTTMMTIFWMNYLAATIRAVNPDVYSSNGFIAVFVGLIACVSGSFLGRALRVFWYQARDAKLPSN